MDMKTSPLSLLKDPSLLKTDALINGQWVSGSSRFDVLDPSNGHKLVDVANLGAADADEAIAAANAAWPAWKAKTAKERSIILRKWFDLLKASPLVKPRAKWPMAPALWSGVRKKPSASTARPCPSSTTTAA